MADLRPLHDWSGPPGTLTLWSPSAASTETAMRAPASAILPSYEQEQHLRAFRACEQQHEEMARLLIVVWDEPGRCDLRAMTYVLNAHVRRRDTYHSWFEECGGTIVRHVIAEPSAIQMSPSTLGVASAADWRQHVMITPGPFEWDCFRFGVIQRASGFTFFASIDHLHADATIIAFLMGDIRQSYRAVLNGETPPAVAQPGRYLDYCRGQRERAAQMTLADPAVESWIAFLLRNNGRMPTFVLPLEIREDRCLAEYMHLDIFDDTTMVAFESKCNASGARVIGGLLGCAALTEQKLTGRARYSVVTPTTTRKSPQAFSTAGWCMGLVPIDFEVRADSFSKMAATAQAIFDERLSLANVPIERILELAAGLPTIRPVATGGVMLSYMDVNVPPLSAHIAHEWSEGNGRVYINRGMAAQVALWLFRSSRGLTITAAYPANQTARASMQRYIEAFMATCRQAAAVEMPSSQNAGPRQ